MRSSILGWLTVALFLSALAPGASLAQGVLVAEDPAIHVRLPRPIWPPVPQLPQEHGYRIKELSVQARLQDQVAQVEVSQTFLNTGSRPLEVSFLFPLPYDGAIDRLTLMVDGKEFPAQLLSAAEARKLYEDIVRKNRDPALLEWMGTGLFKTSVFPVPPGAERKVSLRYTQVCRKDVGVTDFLFPLSTAKYTSEPIDNVHIQLAIESSHPLKAVYSPTHSVEVKRTDDHHATVAYTAAKQIPREDFRLLFDVGAGALGATLLSYRPNESDDGYFLLLASPEIKPSDAPRPGKTVLLVLDRSGSMSGKKIEQAKASLRLVINNLHDGDLFNLVAYDSVVESFKPELQRFDAATRQAALGWIEGIYAGGSTNIDGALQAALKQLSDPARPSYVVFLTDGLPTEGERNEAQIVAKAKEANKVRARILSFGVGYDVNSRLLDRLVRENFGHSGYVRPDEDIEAHVSRLYQRIESPVLTELDLKVVRDGAPPEEGAAVNRHYPRQLGDLFAGDQLALVGRYKKPGQVKLTLRGRQGEAEPTFEFAGELAGASGDAKYGFIEKLWAMRRVGEIIDDLDLKGQNDELIKELVELATRHGILTPYTSFLADENGRLDVASNLGSAREGAQALGHTAGRSGLSQRYAKNQLRSAGGQFGFALPGAQAAQSSADAAAAVAGAQVIYRDEDDRIVAVRNVQQVGNKTFYRRGQAWIDSTVTDADQKQAVRVVQFSDEYFALASRNGRELAQYLAWDEPVYVNLAGQVYQIDPPPAM